MGGYTRDNDLPGNPNKGMFRTLQTQFFISSPIFILNSWQLGVLYVCFMLPELFSSVE